MKLTYRKAAQSDAIQALYIALVLLFVLTGIVPPFLTRIKCNKDGIGEKVFLKKGLSRRPFFWHIHRYSGGGKAP